MNTITEHLKFLVIDDHPLYRKGVVGLLKSMNFNFECQEAGDGFEALEKYKKNKFDIIFLDIQMPKMDGIECFKKLRIINPECKIIIISSFDSNNFVKEFMDKGVNGYLLKNIDGKILSNAIFLVHKNEQFICPEVYNKWYQFKADYKEKDIKVQLTNRETEIVKLMCQNFTSKQISELFGISIATVKNHRNHKLNKLGAKNIADVIVYAIREGIFHIDSIQKIE